MSMLLQFLTNKLETPGPKLQTEQDPKLFKPRRKTDFLNMTQRLASSRELSSPRLCRPFLRLACRRFIVLELPGLQAEGFV